MKVKINNKIEIITILSIIITISSSFAYHAYKLKLNDYGIYSFTFEINNLAIIFNLICFLSILFTTIFATKLTCEIDRLKKIYSFKSQKFRKLKKDKNILISNKNVFVKDKNVIKRYKAANKSINILFLIYNIIILWGLLDYKVSRADILIIIIIAIILSASKYIIKKF